MSSLRRSSLVRVCAGMAAFALSALLSLALVSCGEDSNPTGNTPINRAPAAPAIDTSSGAPADAATAVAGPVTLHWTCSDPDGDDLTYDVHFGSAPDPPAVSTDQSAASHGPMTAAEGETYYWRVIASDPDGKTTSSPVWSFTMAAATGDETVSTPEPPAGAATGEIGQSLNFTAFGTVSSHGHALQYRFDWADGVISTWSSAATVQHSWAAADDYGMKVQARCGEHNDIESDWSAERVITILAGEVTSAPELPSGPAGGETGMSLSYDLSGAVNSRGHSVEYRVDWGTGAMSNWSANTSASYSWSTVGDYDVRAMSRCATHPSVESDWSPVLTVSIGLPGETITRPGNGAGALGPEAGATDVEQEFTINWTATSNLGHDVEHQFDWDDGQMSDWTTSLTAGHAWNTVGTYTVKLRGRCIEHPSAVSDWSDSNPIEITDAGESLSDPTLAIYDGFTAFTPVRVYINNVTSNIGDAVEYQWEWDSDGLSEWQDANSMTHAFSFDGPVNIRGRARCKTHPEVESAWSPVRAVTVAEGNSYLIPVEPAAGYVLHEIVFTTQESFNSSGHTVEYSFNFGTGEGISDWSTNLTAAHTYDSPGQKIVRVTARCLEHPAVTRVGQQQIVWLTWQPTTETITRPTQPTGPATGGPNTPITFSTTECTSNEGHEVWYRFKAIRSGQLRVETDWSPSLSQELTFTQYGGYSIYAVARCSIHPEAFSTQSLGGYITISAP